MARPKTVGPPSSGALAYKRNDPRRLKPAWFDLGGYFSEKGEGNKGVRSSSTAQQKSNKGNRGSRNGKTVS